MGQMTIFVVKYVFININGHGYLINLSTTMSCHIVVHCHKLTGDTSTPLLTVTFILMIINYILLIKLVEYCIFH